MIVLCLEEQPLRFTQLRQALGRVRPKVLAETLRSMERDGLVRRNEYAENPPHVEYELTVLGRSLLQLIEAARVWARDHLDELLRERSKHGSYT